MSEIRVTQDGRELLHRRLADDELDARTLREAIAGEIEWIAAHVDSVDPASITSANAAAALRLVAENQRRLMLQMRGILAALRFVLRRTR